MAENTGTIRTEHALLMSGGSMQVYNDHPDHERIYPVAKRVQHDQRTGGRVYRRRIIVVDDWEPMPTN